MPLTEVSVNCSPGYGDECDECECKSDPWHRVLLLVLCCTATRLLLLQIMSDPWHSVQLPVLCVYLLEWFRSRRFAAGSISGNTAKLHPWWRAQFLSWPSACFWSDTNLYSTTALCIRLNSSKIHSSSSIYTAACSAAFGAVCLSASTDSHSTPSQLSVFHMLHTQRACPFWVKDPTQRSCGS